MKASEGSIDIQGYRHYFKEMGSGETLIFLHGGPGIAHDYFLPYVEPLADGFRLLFYD